MYTYINNYYILFTIYGNGKGAAIPLQPLTDPEGSRRLRLLDFSR
jgi:hypothetical protein